MKRLTIFLLFAGGLSAGAQQKYFTEEGLISVIANFHPVAKQADVDVKIAKTGILSSRSGFDPTFSGGTARKEFGGITYYDQQVNELTIPTWYGIDFYAGTESISGSRVNPEETKGRTTYLGVSIQPLQNLLMDNRRSAVLKAKNMHLLSEVQKRMVINDLFQEALYSYWDWWEKYQVQQIAQGALSNAGKRFSLVKAAYTLGDRPAIDTVEAYTQVQAFGIKVSEAQQNLLRAHLHLATFLWTADGRQTDLPFDVVPQPFTGTTSFELPDFSTFVKTHPELLQYDFKLKEIAIDKKLAFQSLMPGLKLKYNQLGYNLSETVHAPWFDNNYRFGVSFSVPLRFSEGRGDYQKAKLKIKRTQLELANKQVQLYTKVKQYYSDWQQTVTQLSLQQGLMANTSTLQRAEETRLNNGEGSLFLVNAREQKTIEAEQKLVELKAKTKKAAIAVRWSAGMLGL